jgi:hypothetical protein
MLKGLLYAGTVAVSFTVTMILTWPAPPEPTVPFSLRFLDIVGTPDGRLERYEDALRRQALPEADCSKPFQNIVGRCDA